MGLGSGGRSVGIRSGLQNDGVLLLCLCATYANPLSRSQMKHQGIRPFTSLIARVSSSKRKAKKIREIQVSYRASYRLAKLYNVTTALQKKRLLSSSLAIRLLRIPPNTLTHISVLTDTIRYSVHICERRNSESRFPV